MGVGHRRTASGSASPSPPLSAIHSCGPSQLGHGGTDRAFSMWISKSQLVHVYVPAETSLPTGAGFVMPMCSPKSRIHKPAVSNHGVNTCLTQIPWGTCGPSHRESSKGGRAMPMGKERTKEQLYTEAKRLGIKGRSKMNKGQLKAALQRRGH